MLTENKEVPEGWKTLKLSDVCNLNPSKPKVEDKKTLATFLGMTDLSEEGRVTGGEPKAVSLLEKGFTSFQDEDVLVAKITPCFENGKGALVTDLKNGFGYGSTEFHVLRAKSNVTPEFIYYHTRTHKFISEGTANMVGSAGHRRVQSEFVGNYTIIVPPLPEQNKIVKILSIVDKKLEKIELKILATQQLEKGLMQKLFSEGAGIPIKDGNGHVIWQPHAEFEKSGLGSLPKGWKLRAFDSLTHKITDGAHHTPKYIGSGVPFLRVTDLKNKDIDLSRTKFISQVEHEILIKRCKPERGDILYSKNGTIGIPKLVDWDFEFSVFVSLCLIKPNDDIDAKFLELMLKSPLIHEQIRKQAKQGAVTNLHLEDIRKFQIPTPPLPEQNRIAVILTAVLDKLKHIENEKNKVVEMKKGLMQKLLTGQLRVKVDEEYQVS